MAPAAVRSYKQALLATQKASTEASTTTVVESFDACRLIKNFLADPSTQTLELPRTLTAEQRKQVKREAEKCSELRCDSFGFGEERQLHVFKRKQAGGAKLEQAEPVKVKNTFIDDWVQTGQFKEWNEPAEPAACRSMPASLRSPSSRLSAMSTAALPAIAELPALLKGDTATSPGESSTCASETSSAASPTEANSPASTSGSREIFQDPPVRNTFIHFQLPAPALDARAVQSMPDGAFRRLLQAEQQDVLNKGATCAAATTTPLLAAGRMEGSSSGSPASRDIAPGDEVCVQGLTKAPAFNGRRGTVQGFDVQTGRYSVVLTGEAGSQLAKVKLENLVLVTPKTPDHLSAHCLELDADDVSCPSSTGSPKISFPRTPLWDEKPALNLTLLV